jgi:hypothetical protein
MLETTCAGLRLHQYAELSNDTFGGSHMNIMKPVLAGMALAIAATVTFSMADTAFAKSKKHHEAGTTQANPDETTRPSDLGGSDRQLQGRFYKSHKSHKKADSSK